MAAPIVYRWDDGNAPVARGERRSLCDILHACLVTGYGTKPGAGWTREFINATFDTAAFRNNPITGTGFFLQVDGLGGVNVYTPYVQGFESMTSETSGLFPFAQVASSTVISATAGTTARPWILIADDRAFYFICFSAITGTPSNTEAGTPGIFFGDIEANNIDDAFACGLTPAPGTTVQFGYLTGPSGAVAPSSQGVYFPRKAAGAPGSYFATQVRGGGPGTESRAGDAGPAYSVGGQAIITRPHINDGVAFSFRGFLPGFYYPCHNLPFNQFQTVNVDNVDYMSLRIRIINGYGNVLISLADWRA